MEPTKKQMTEWAKKHGPLFVVQIEDYEFLCREITRAEYREITDTIEDEYEKEEQVCRLCLLCPEEIEFEDHYAGLPNAMASKILEESGFGESGAGKVKALMEKYKSEMDDFMNQVSCIIHEAFPMLDLEEIENWSLEKTLWYFTRAEWKMKTFRGFGQQDTGEGEVQGDPQDFPELAAEEAFMSGKMTK